MLISYAQWKRYYIYFKYTIKYILAHLCWSVALCPYGRKDSWLRSRICSSHTGAFIRSRLFRDFANIDRNHYHHYKGRHTESRLESIVKQVLEAHCCCVTIPFGKSSRDSGSFVQRKWELGQKSPYFPESMMKTWKIYRKKISQDFIFFCTGYKSSGN